MQDFLQSHEQIHKFLFYADIIFYYHTCESLEFTVTRAGLQMQSYCHHSTYINKQSLITQLSEIMHTKDSQKKSIYLNQWSRGLTTEQYRSGFKQSDVVINNVGLQHLSIIAVVAYGGEHVSIFKYVYTFTYLLCQWPPWRLTMASQHRWLGVLCFKHISHDMCP